MSQRTERESGLSKEFEIENIAKLPEVTPATSPKPGLPPNPLTFIEKTVAILSIAAQEAMNEVPELESVSLVFGWKREFRSNTSPGLSLGRNGEIKHPGETFGAIEQVAKVLERLTGRMYSSISNLAMYGESVAQEIKQLETKRLQMQKEPQHDNTDPGTRTGE